MSVFWSLCGLVLLAIVLPGEGRPKKEAPTGSTKCPPKRCANLWEPVCGSDGRTFSNKCQMDLVVACWGEKVVLKSTGQCPECPEGVPYVNCFADPCGTSSCPSNPTATCKPNYCGGCNAVWYDSSGDVVDCAVKTASEARVEEKSKSRKKGEPPTVCKFKVAQCPPGVVAFKCLVDPCAAASCPSHPGVTCKPNYCGGCRAEFFDANGSPVDCSKTDDQPMMDLPPVVTFKRGPLPDGPRITIPVGIPSPKDQGAPGTAGAGGLKPGQMPDPPKNNKPIGSWLGSGQAPPVPMSSDKSISVSGTLKSTSPSGKLPKGSCLVLALRDVSLMDVASFELASTTRPITDEDIGQGFTFVINSKKPEEDQLWRRYSVSAVINVGWCPGKDSDEWIRKGDYLSTAQYTVRMEKGKDEYNDLNVELDCYDCVKKADLVPPPPAAGPPSEPAGMQAPPIPKPCELEKSKVKPGLLGAFTPSCKPDGSYEDKQCHGSTGHCWCVNSAGLEILGTRKGPGEGDVTCGGPCTKHAANVKDMPGAYVPQCKDNGLYQEKQCHASVGECWCVIPFEGKEIPETRKSVRNGENVSCGGDMSDIEVKLSDKDMVIRGVIKPDKMKVPAGIPGKSCMTIKFEDVSLMDASSVTIAEVEVPVISDDFSMGVPYSIKAKKPFPNEFWRTLAVAVVINVGWCRSKDSDEWIRKGDWHTATIHPIKLNPIEDSYKLPITLECYACNRKTSGKVKVARALPAVDPTGAPKPDCMVICGYNYEPTCGTDGKTYSNKCLLSAAIQCENKPDLAVKSEGPCPGLCAKALENAKPIPGGFLPSCKEDGSYDEKQCHSSTGQCWCVDENGQEINGTRNKPGEETTNCVSCAMRQANSKPVPGAFVPSCKADGSYEERQCHTSTGFCWCVNEDGKELVGTKKGPGEGEPDCSVQLSCAEQLAANTKPVPGAYEPTCKDDGSFTEKQCHGSSGYCWCVTPDGKEINGTKRAPGEGAVICGTCAMRRDNAKSMPGAFAPTCKDDGSYEKMQCDGSTGHCWCVNEDGKELVGTRKGPTEGKPHCESCAMRRANSKPMPGEFVPTCKDDGSYEEKQCHPSTGSCWCVSPDGKQITGTEKGPTEGEPICSDPCTQPPLTGKCRGYFVRYHYNQKSKSCEEFVYGGCGANRNNFETVEACNKACGKKTA